MTFEKFVATFQKEFDNLEMYECGMHNGDIVDLLWIKMGNTELVPYVVSMKVHYQAVRRGYKKNPPRYCNSDPVACTNNIQIQSLGYASSVCHNIRKWVTRKRIPYGLRNVVHWYISVQEMDA